MHGLGMFLLKLLQYFFEIGNSGYRLVDLPGYGFAKVPDVVRKRWEQSLEEYFLKRKSLKGLILLMDIRHPLTPADWKMIDWTTSMHLPVHILLTKADKLTRGPALQTLHAVQKMLTAEKRIPAELVTVQLFSATAKQGIQEALEKISIWLLS